MGHHIENSDHELQESSKIMEIGPIAFENDAIKVDNANYSKIRRILSEFCQNFQDPVAKNLPRENH